LEGDREVVKGSSRHEPIQVVIHMCIEAMLGICLYSYLYLKLAKMMSFLLSLMFSLQQNWRAREWNRFCLEARRMGGGGGGGGGRERWPKQCMHI
jgi:hypothetical protein